MKKISISLVTAEYPRRRFKTKSPTGKEIETKPVGTRNVLTCCAYGSNIFKIVLFEERMVPHFECKRCKKLFLPQVRADKSEDKA